MSALREILVAFGYEFDKKEEAALLNGINLVKKAAIGLGVAFGAKEIVNFVSDTVAGVAKLGDDIGELAQKVGVNAQALQELGFIAKDSGASMSDLATSMRFISKNAVAAKDGSKEMRAAFSRLGVSVTDANGRLKTAENLFVELSDGFVNVKDPAERTALAMKVLGRSGTQLLPTLLKGSAALERLRARARELGIVMGDDLLEAGDKYQTAVEESEAATEGLKIAFAQGLLPIFTDMKIAATEMLIALRPFVAMLGRALGPVVVFVGRVMKGLLQAVVSIADYFRHNWQPIILSLSAGLTALAAAAVYTGNASLIAGFKAAAGWIIALAPILLMILAFGIIAAAIFLLIEDFVRMGEGAESVTGTMIQGFMDLVEEIGSIPGAIWDMLKFALDFWIEFFGGAKNVASEFFAWIFGKWMELGNFIANIPGMKQINAFAGKALDTIGLGGSPTGNIAGVNSSAPLAGAPAGGGTTINQGGTNLDIKVDAAGTGANAQDIASEVSKQVNWVLEQRDRELIQPFVVASPSPTGG